MEDNLTGRIYAIFNRLFHVPANQLSEQTERRNLEEWDSLGHLVLIEALSQEFGIQISAEEALELDAISDIKQLVLKSRLTD